MQVDPPPSAGAAHPADRPSVGAAPAVLSAELLRSWRALLVTLPLPTDDAARVDLLRGLEELKSTAAALQARVAADFDSSQRAAQVAAGMDPRDVGRVSPRRWVWLVETVRRGGLGTWASLGRWSESCRARGPR